MRVQVLRVTEMMERLKEKLTEMECIIKEYTQ